MTPKNYFVENYRMTSIMISKDCVNYRLEYIVFSKI